VTAKPLQHKSFSTLATTPVVEKPDWIAPRVIPRSSKVLMGAVAKAGKALHPDEPVLTTTGWKAIGSLLVGEELASTDGASSVVQALLPQPYQPIYRVHLWDGRHVDCTGDHLWTVNYEYHGTCTETVDTITLQEWLERGYCRGRIWLPTPTGDWGKDDGLPIDPWLLGVLLGDGGFTGSSIILTTADDQIVAKVRSLINGDLVFAGNYGWRIRDGAEIKYKLVDLGLYGHKSQTKVIPPQYMAASLESRKALLRGLIDTDGTVEKRGTMSFASTSEELAKQVQSLVWSVGGLSKISSKVPTIDGVKYSRCYRVGVRHQEADELVSLSRKQERINDNRKCPRQKILAVEQIGQSEAVCISVSHETGLYVTRDYTLTHNSFLTKQIVLDAGLSRHVFNHPLMKTVTSPRCLYVEQEVGEAGVHDRVSRMMAGFTPEQIEAVHNRLYVVSRDNDIRADTLAGDKRIREYLDEVKPNILFLDPISRLMEGNDSDNREVRLVFANVDRWLEDYKELGLSVVLIHHFGKPNADRNKVMDPLSPFNFRGASDWYNSPDTLITAIGEGDHYEKVVLPDKSWKLTMRVETRHNEQLSDFTVWLHRARKLGVEYWGEETAESPPPPKSLEAEQIRIPWKQ
jgi:hypothetical protein